MGVASMSKASAVAAGAASLLFFSSPHGCSSFVLQSSPLRPTPYQTKGRSRVAVAASPSFRRPRPAVVPIPSSQRRGNFARMASEPEEAVAEKGDSVEDQSIPEGEAIAEGLADEPNAEADKVGDEVDEPEVAAEQEGEEGEGVKDGEADEGEEEEEEKEEEEEEEVDPMAEIKQQIKDLEIELQAEENKLADARDAIDEKGQTGFLRLAAKVDNFRKSSGSGSGAYADDAKAAVLQAMLPAFAPFEEAEEKLTLESENEIKFNGNYQALYRQLKDVFTKIGASDFYGVVGEKFEARRHEKVSEEHNEIMASGNILECLSPGLELRTNIVRKAKCVVSLGPEKVEEEAIEEEIEEEGQEGGGAAEAGALRDAGDVGVGAEEAEENVDDGEEEAPAGEEPEPAV